THSRVPCLCMSSYCIRCGHRLETAVPQLCPECGGAAPVHELDDGTFGRLWHAGVQVALEDVGVPRLSWKPAVLSGPLPASAPSHYNPTPPGELMLTMSRPNEEMVLSLIHELGHAILHPVGQEHDLASYQEHPGPEERLVHAAADVACQQYGIDGYIPCMLG